MAVSDKQAHDPGFGGRIIAEAIRLEEDRAGKLLDEPQALQQALERGGDFEQRIITRALHTRKGSKLQQAFESLHQFRFWFVIVAVLLALFAGIGAANAVFRDEATVNIVLALAALLGVQLLMLGIWFALLVFRPGSGGGGTLGRLLLDGANAVGRRIYRHHDAALLLQATFGLLRRDGIGRWLASSLSHTLWATFCLGALLWSLLELSIRQYDFVWGTTVLSEQSFVTLISLLGFPARLLGMDTPDAELILASRMGQWIYEGRGQWSALLLSAIFFYGVLPRLLLALLTGALAWRAIKALRLNTGLQGYARLSERLAPRAQNIGVVDPVPPRVGREQDLSAPREAVGTGAVMLIGVELERDDHHWPPQLAGVDWLILGRADERSQRRDVLAALRAQTSPPPGVVLVVCSLARTPDRGTQNFIHEVRAATPAPVWLILDEAPLLVARGGDPEARTQQWQEMAKVVAVDHMMTADLADAAHPGCEALRQALGHLKVSH